MLGKISREIMKSRNCIKRDLLLLCCLCQTTIAIAPMNDAAAKTTNVACM